MLPASLVQSSLMQVETGLCMTIHMRQDETREQYLAKRRAYYQSHKKEYHEYYESNKEKWKVQAEKRKCEEYRIRHRKYNAKYRAKDPERQNARSRAWSLAHPEVKRNHYKNNKQKYIDRAKEYDKQHPLEKKVRGKLYRAVKTGKIKKQPCEVCGNPKADAHHDDYNSPLEVRWLCRSHHAEWHAHNKPIHIDG